MRKRAAATAAAAASTTSSSADPSPDASFAPPSLCGARVVELGCGTGLVGLACLSLGAWRVLFTDVDSRPLRRIAASLGPAAGPPGAPPRAACATLDWADGPEGAFAILAAAAHDTLPDDSVGGKEGGAGDDGGSLVLVGADVLFDPPLFEPLIALVAALLRRHAAVRGCEGGPSSAAAVFVTAVKLRCPTRTIGPILERHGLRGRLLATAASLAPHVEIFKRWIPTAAAKASSSSGGGGGVGSSDRHESGGSGGSRDRDDGDVEGGTSLLSGETRVMLEDDVVVFGIGLKDSER